MIETRTLADLAAELERCGDPRETTSWREGNIDYIAKLGLDRAHVPALLRCARRRIEREHRSDDPDDTSWYAPIHAWRALAHLGAEEAVPLLLEMIGPMDAEDDDWHLEEFPHAFALIGPAAFDTVAEYLACADNAEYPRVCAAHALARIAERHPDERDRAVGTLTELLREHGTNPHELNAFLVTYLIRLKATESTEVIERAFADGCVAEWVVGNWATVREDLGVKGIGLVSEARARRVPRFLDLFDPPATRTRGRSKSKAAAKRKAQRKARKRNRRR